jgi:hypothetical protein
VPRDQGVAVAVLSVVDEAVVLGVVNLPQLLASVGVGAVIKECQLGRLPGPDLLLDRLQLSGELVLVATHPHHLAHGVEVGLGDGAVEQLPRQPHVAAVPGDRGPEIAHGGPLVVAPLLDKQHGWVAQQAYQLGLHLRLLAGGTVPHERLVAAFNASRRRDDPEVVVVQPSAALHVPGDAAALHPPAGINER